MIWHILTTAPQREFRARDEIKRLGMRTYVPAELRHRRAIGKQGRPVMIPYNVPLMPGYVFVGAPACWRDVMELRDVRGCIWSGGKPAALADAQIDHVRRLANEIKSESRRGIVKGDSATILAGPFRGLDALVAEITGTSVTLELQLFGARREIEVRPDLVERAA